MSFFRGYLGPTTTPKTIYQTTFIDPRKYTVMCYTSKDKGPYHPLKGTPHDMSTVRTKFVRKPKLSTQPKIPRVPIVPNSFITVRKFACSPEPQVWSAGDYTSVYSRDYRDWRKEVPERFKSNWAYDQMLHSSRRNRTFATREKQMPFESTTTYSADYVRHHL